MSSTPPSNYQPPTRLIAHFQNRQSNNQSSGWSELWDSDQSDLWDRGFSSPALVDLLEQRTDLLPTRSEGCRLKALVPGCGKGYDVVLLALHGIDAYGLEVSQTAVDVASQYSKTELSNPSSYHFNMPTPSARRGKIQFLLGDFFAIDWQTQFLNSRDDSKKFDLIYDYTFLCALPPRLRRQWAQKMQSLLSPSGILICLEFPLYKSLNAEGPPWGLRGVYWDLLVNGGDGILKEENLADNDDDDGDGDSVSGPGGTGKGAFTRVVRYKPERSYPNGKGTDMISVWKLKAS